jgi:putative ABC transport system ATP-binding protein
VIDLLRETCREDEVAMILVTHATEVSDQFERVEQLEEINQVRPK